MEQVLLISGIGMGLVFVAILLLWLLMELLVRFTADRLEAVAPIETVKTEIKEQNQPGKMKVAAAAVATAVRLRKRQAALIAVAVALAKQKTPGNEQMNETSTSSWQSVMRSLQHRERTRLFNRRPRGRA